jgi:N utilization substance protein A
MNDKEALKDLIESMAMEYRLSSNEIVEALGNSLVESWKKIYGEGYNISFEYRDGIKLYRILTPVEEVEDYRTQIKSKETEDIKEELSLDLPRSAIASAVSSLKTQLKVIHKKREYDLYKDQVGKVISCIVKKNQGQSAILSVAGFFEGIIPSNFFVLREKFQPGDKILCRLHAVNYNLEDYQLVFERKSKEFLVEVLHQMIPEIENGTVTIKKLVRESGSMSKVLVESDSNVNAVGACIGFKGKRLKPIIEELKGEKVDFLLWKDSLVQRIISCFNRIPLKKIFFQSENECVVVVNDDLLGEAIGRNGQNIRLIMNLLELNIKIMSQSEYNEKELNKQKEIIDNLINIGIPENVSSRIVEKYGENIKNAIEDSEFSEFVDFIKDYLNNLIKLEEQLFVQSGGSYELFDLVVEMPVSVKQKLIDNKIFTINDLQRFANAFELSNYTGIEPEYCAILTWKNN